MLNHDEMSEQLATERPSLLAHGAAWDVDESTMRAINFTRNTTHRNLRARYGLHIETLRQRRAIFTTMGFYFTVAGKDLALTALKYYFRKIPKLLSLWWCAANDATIETSTVPNRITSLITALENSIRGNNRNDDLDQDDGNQLYHSPICAEGLKNQLAICMQEAYGAAHPDNVYIPDVPEEIRGCLPRYLQNIYRTSPYQLQIKEAMDAIGDSNAAHPAPANQITFFNIFTAGFTGLAQQAFYLKHGSPELPHEQKQVAETFEQVIANLHYTNVPDPVTSLPEVLLTERDIYGTINRREPPNIRSEHRAAKKRRAY